MSYLYVYDQELGHPSHHKLLSKLEAHILELGIKGRIVRLSPLKNLKEVVDDAAKSGVQTVVAVGSDATLTQVVAAAAPSRLVVGFIPTSTKSNLARVFGLPPLLGAADVVSARIIKTIDLGRANHSLFIDCAEIESPSEVTVSFAQFSIDCVPGAAAAIANVGFSCAASRGATFDPMDGKLDLLVAPSKGQSLATHLSVNTVVVRDHGNTSSIRLDGTTTLKTPVQIEVVPRALKIIVGSDRIFS